MTIRKLFSIITLLVLSFILVACKTTTTTTSKDDLDYEYTKPTISNPDQVVYTKGDISLTKADIYKSLKLNGGMDSLLLEIDKKMLSEKISAISTTSEEYINKYNSIVYGKTDQAEIDAMENKDQKLKDFNSSLALLGYTTDASKEDYIKVLVAREQTAYDYMKKGAKEDTHGSFYYTMSTVENFYGSTKNVDSTCKAIVINYKSMSEFYDALDALGENIALFNGKFYKNPNNVPKRNYSEDVLTPVSNDEAKTLFEALYQGQYGVNASPKEYKYNDLQKADPTIANIIFSLNENEYIYIATKNSAEYGDVFTIAYRTEGNKAKEWKDFTDEEKNGIEDKFCSYITESGQYTTTLMGIVRNLNGIKFNDLSFGYKYFTTYCGTYNYDTKGDEKVLVTWDGGQLTVDEFYDNATKNNVGYYALYAAVPKLLSESSFYSLAYGQNKDITTNASLRKAEYTKTVQTDLNSNYIKDKMHFESVYLYNKYGVETVEDAVIFNKIAGDFDYLIGLETLGSLVDGVYTLNADAETVFNNVINNIYSGYYKMRIYDFNISFDNDVDFKKDNGSEYNEALVDLLVNKVKEEMYKDENGNVSEAELTISTLNTRMARIIQEYNDPSKDKKGTYTDLRLNNYILSYAGVNAGNLTESISYKANTTTEMDAALINAYNHIIVDPELSSTKVYINDTVVYDKDGAHFLFFFEPNALPSYKLTEEGEYSELFLNEESKMTVNQLAQAYYVYTYKTLFTDASKASSSYGVENYPASPSDLSFDSYTTLIAKYYTSDSNTNLFFVDKLLGGSDNNINEQLLSYKEPFKNFYPVVSEFEDQTN